MQSFSLDGQWTLNSKALGENISAPVPGDVHGALLEAKRIPDPYWRDNETKLQWIGETDWTYSRMFDLSAELLAAKKILLRFDGLDTLATIKLNGKTLGRTDNMFRFWEFDVTDALKAKANRLEVTFASAQKFVDKMQKKTPLYFWGWDHKCGVAAHIRKMQCNFGWDWGPMLVTCGIWRGVNLLGIDSARLTNVKIAQQHRAGKVSLNITADVESVRRGDRSLHVTVRHNGRKVAEADTQQKGKQSKISLKIENPKLWWPVGSGDQPLYDVCVELLDHDGAVIDIDEKRIGLRTTQLRRRKDKWGESFEFVVNGRAIFIKGANWIPADAVYSRVEKTMLNRLLDDTVAANMNMVRAWGGGVYESEDFYDLCDEKGLLVWQDFMFACANYPITDDAFVENCRIEAVQQVRRLQHRACLALWCGNNELEQGLVNDDDPKMMNWADYKKFFDGMLGGVVKKEDGATDFWPCSPSSSRDRKNHASPLSGDTHYWGVWHGRLPFETYRELEHRFISEFGFQSFTEPKTTAEFTLPEDRNITSPVFDLHQRSGPGNRLIVQYMLDQFRMPTGFDNTLYLSQIQQAMAMEMCIEHARRSRPRCMGTIYWQLNDCWPAASWASIDYPGRWKALHYAARRFYAPLAVSLLEDNEKGRMDVWVASDLDKPKRGKIAWAVVHVDGCTLAADTQHFSVKPDSSARVLRLELSDLLKEHGSKNLVVFADLIDAGEVLSSGMGRFALYKQLGLKEPQISVSVKALNKDSFEVTLKASRPAFWCWLELKDRDATYNDNYFHIQPDCAEKIVVTPEKPTTLQQFKKALVVRSLVDTYR